MERDFSLEVGVYRHACEQLVRTINDRASFRESCNRINYIASFQSDHALMASYAEILHVRPAEVPVVSVRLYVVDMLFNCSFWSDIDVDTRLNVLAELLYGHAYLLSHRDLNSILNCALQSNQKKIVRELLKNSCIFIMLCTFDILKKSSEKGEIRTVEELILNGPVARHEYESGCRSLLAAAQNGHYGVFKKLYDSLYVFSLSDSCRETILISAARNGWVHIVVLMLASGAGSIVTALTKSLHNLHFTVFRLIVSWAFRKSVDALPSLGPLECSILCDDFNILNCVLCSPYAELLRQHLSDDSVFSPVEDDVYHTLKFLLDIRYVFNHAHMDNNRALCKAVKLGSYKLVNHLLKVPHVKECASVCGNRALVSACISGNAAIVGLLLAVDDVRRSAAANENKALRCALIKGHSAIVCKLISIQVVEDALADVNQRYQPGILSPDFDLGLSYLETAFNEGHRDLVKLLLCYESVTTSLDSMSFLQDAFIEIVKDQIIQYQYRKHADDFDYTNPLLCYLNAIIKQCDVDLLKRHLIFEKINWLFTQGEEYLSFALPDLILVAEYDRECSEFYLQAYIYGAGFRKKDSHAGLAQVQKILHECDFSESSIQQRVQQTVFIRDKFSNERRGQRL